MSGHSKWHNIQKKKGAADAKRGQVFTKLAKAITIAAKEGGGADPSFNFQLRVAIDTAKSANMPKNNIERAIKRGTGEAGEGGQIDEVIYEGFGPGGSAILIKCLTDNRNRSIAEVRTVMNKKGGNLGEQGTVKWMFEQKGVVVIQEENITLDADEFDLRLIESGAEDIERFEGVVQVTTALSDLKTALELVEELNIKPEVAGLEYVAKDLLQISGDDKAKLDTLVEALDELEDIDEVFTNEK
jgi:YebC/PmpR family DNA-binding regulatory protein